MEKKYSFSNMEINKFNPSNIRKQLETLVKESRFDPSNKPVKNPIVVDTNSTLTKLELEPFSAEGSSSGAWFQTVFPTMSTPKDYLKYKRNVIAVKENVNFYLYEYTPANWKDGDNILILHHGFCGTYESSYMIRLTNKFYRLGFKVLRINALGAGYGAYITEQFYHPGDTSTVFKSLDFCERHFNNSKCYVAGHSMGGNVVLKYGGEINEHPPLNLKGLIAISTPFDINLSFIRASKTYRGGFESFFVSEIKKEVETFLERNPHLVQFKMPQKCSAFKSGEVFSKNLFGENNVKDFFAVNSSINYTSKIKVNTLILSSMDDPVSHTKTILNKDLSSNVDLIVTKRGGHLGFFEPSMNQRSLVYWSDKLIEKWIAQF